MVLSPADNRLYVALAVNFVVMGLAMTVFSATVPQIITGFSWSYLATGLVLTANAIGGFVATFAIGILLKRVSPKLLLILSLMLVSLSLGLFGVHTSPWYNGALFFLIGAGNGCVEVITNSVVIRLEKRGESRLMNLMHAGFCVGAVLGPVMVGLMTLASLPIQAYFLAAACIQIASLTVVGFQGFPRLSLATGEIGSDRPKKMWADPVFFRPLLWVLSAIIFLYVGVELALSNWVAEFFRRFRSLGDSDAALIVSVYWGGLLVGRVLLFLFSRGNHQERILAILAFSSLLTYAASVLIPTAIPAMCAVFLTGLAFSGVYPIVMSMIGARFNGSTAAMGVGATAGGVGLFFFTFATGFLAQELGLHTALLLMAICDGILCATAVLLLWRTRTKIPPSI